MQQFPRDTSSYCRFYIVRHGQTEWNVQRRVQGHLDSPLTLKGQEQAKIVAQELKSIPFDAIYSSDLLRAKHTAETISLEHKLAVQTHKLLRERNFGKLEGVPIQELRQFDAIYEQLDDLGKQKYKIADDVESDEEIATRFITFLREVAVLYPGKTVLVITHSGIMKAFLIKIGFGTYQTLPHGSIANAAYIQLLSDGIDFFVEETKGITKQE